MRLAHLCPLVACLFAVQGVGPAQAHTPAFPGARRDVEPGGRWYVAVESWSDRCALVERAPGSPPVPELVDLGGGAHGLPGPEPVRPGDRVVVRTRLRSYPRATRADAQGSGFAALTTEVDGDGRSHPSLSLVRADGLRLALRLPAAAPAPGASVLPGFDPDWRIEDVRAEEGQVVLHDPAGRRCEARFTEGAVRLPGVPGSTAHLGGSATAPGERAWRLGRTGARGPSPEGVAEALGLLLDQDPNVVRAASWLLGRVLAEGRAAATACLLDPGAPTLQRARAAWALSDTESDTVLPALEAAAGRRTDPVAADALAALGALRWTAGPAFLRLLGDGSRPSPEVVRYFGRHRVAGAAPSLIQALGRAEPGGGLARGLLEALQTQTGRHDLPADAAAWARALGLPPAGGSAHPR